MTKTVPFILLILLLSACATLITDILDYGSLEVETVTRSGSPVPGTEIALYNDVQVVALGFTGTDGKYLFEFVPPQFYGVHNEPPSGYMRPEDMIGGPPTAHTDQIEMEEGDKKAVSFTLVKIGPGRIDVSVTDVNGTPLEETEVILYGPQGDLSEKLAGPAGSVSFDPVSFGNWGIRVVPPRLYMDEDEGSFFQDRILIDEGWTEEVSFALEKCLGTLRATVQDASGAPFPEYPIRLYTSKGELDVKGTGADGMAVFDSIACGNRGLALGETPGWASEKEGRGLSFYDGISVTRGSDQTFSFQVESCLGTLRATVQDASGAPFPEYPIRLYGLKGDLDIKDTGADGMAVFDSIACGDRGLALGRIPGWVFEEGRGLDFYDGISVTRGSDQTFSFQVESCLGTLRATVQDASGAPFPEYPIRLYAPKEDLDVKDTGADGMAVFDSIACGDRGLALGRIPGWVFEEGRGLSFYDGISVTHQTDQTFSFQVEPCLGTLRATVQDASRAPVPKHPIRVYAPKGDLDVKDTGADGMAVFDSIACGDLGFALVQRPGWVFEEGRGLSFYDGISVTHQTDQTFSFSVKRCSGEIGIRVEDEAAAAVSGAVLELYSADRTWDQDISGSDGRSTFTEACGMEVGVKIVPPSGYTVPQGRGLSFYDGLRPDLDGTVELVFRLKAS